MAEFNPESQDVRERVLWLMPTEDVMKLPYVREWTIKRSRRTERPPFTKFRQQRVRCVGYELLPRPVGALWERRVYVLKEHDPYEDWPAKAPAEAVDPRTLGD
jgi:Family of unknown function (DUF6009)